MKVYVLDEVGYDTGGGMARVFSTLEKAMAAVPSARWEQFGGNEWWADATAGPYDDKSVIYAVELDSVEMPS